MWNISKRRCIIFFSLFTVCIILFHAFYEEKLFAHEYENCTVRNLTFYKTESKFRKNVNTYVQNSFKDDTFPAFKSPEKWTAMATNMYAYSAFFAKCPSLLSQEWCVKFIGIVLSDRNSFLPFTSTILCSVMDDSHIYTNFTTIELLPERHEKLYSAAYLYCPIKGGVQPTHAAFYDTYPNINWKIVEYTNVPNSRNAKFNAFYTGSISKPPHHISLCVRPFYDYLDFLQISEFLAYYSAMSIDHFIFYYTNSFKPLHTFINFMRFTNISFEILEWNIPLDNDQIHEFGQIAFIQECLLRSKYKFTHTIIVDLDEYLVPNYHKDISALVSFLDDRNPSAGSYVIPMALFCNEYSNKNSHIFPFHILNHRKRQKTTWLHQYRSKYIIRPNVVQYSGIHFTWKLEDNYEEVFVSPNTALINHYRFCCGMGQSYFLHLLEFKVLHDKTVIDNALFDHRNKFLNHPLLKFIMSI